jgi:hypothetical protein
MPYKDPEIRKIKNREAKKLWYQKNKVKHIADAAKYRRDTRRLWMEFKETQECAFCGFSHPAAIDFHHVIRDGTKQSVNLLAQRGSYAKAYEEIKKCIPLCANCHRILHWHEHEEGKAERARQREKNKKSGSHP